MTPERLALLDRIQSFDIDGGEAALPFAARLAREHGWSRPHADRVVREYKRDPFLTATGSEPVCPSEDVDAAWHLHLTYTRSYWMRLCGGVIGRPLHHDPTRGGPAEAGKHLRMYEHTLTAYREAFGENAPADIWPAATERFGIDLHHRVVNTGRNWVLPKRPIKNVLLVAAAFLVCAAFLPGCGGGFNPFDLKGSDFLWFLIPVMLGAVSAGRAIRSVMRTPNPLPAEEAPELTWEQAAHLAGGTPRLTTAAIARLVEANAVRMNVDRLEADRTVWHGNPTRVEQVILSSLPLSKTNLKAVHQAVEASFATEAADLEAQGFTLPTSRQVGVAFAALLPLIFILLVFAVPRLLTGLANNKPVGYLVATMLIGGLVGTGMVLAGSLRLSRRGEAVLATMRERNRKRVVSEPGYAALGVALFGTVALAGTSIAYLQSWYPRQTTEGSSGGCGSGCGSGGDGGGGGGCGGGGCGGGGGD